MSQQAWIEYDKCAEELARKGLAGDTGDPLPNLMSKEAVDLINDDPEAFRCRVRQCAYALANSACGHHSIFDCDCDPREGL